MDICDIHMHVVSRCDDGAKNLAMSLGMLDTAQKQGVTTVFCTSHGWDNTDARERYLSRFAVLKREAGRLFPTMRLFTGCEILCEPTTAEQTIDLLDGGVLLTMNGTRFVLTEFDMDVDGDVACALVGRFLQRGYVPILAHIERYWEWRSSDVARMREMGCKTQINLPSLREAADLRTRMNAELYLHGHMVDFVGSDAHGFTERPPRISEGASRLTALCDGEYLAALCHGNADRWLTDNP